MAEILPFRALHYSPEIVGPLERVVTQPYDKISLEMQTRYHQLSPYNLVRLIRGNEKLGDGPYDNVYLRAARSFEQWRESRALVATPEPALYPYDQEYTLPHDPGAHLRRRGFIGLCRLEDYSAGVVHRHEETLSGPKADRLELLKATRAHFGQIFVLYSDPQGRIESALAGHKRQPPWEQVTDEYGTRHSVWRLTDGPTLEWVVEVMRDRKLVIADGHHRYETALAYRDLRRAQAVREVRDNYVMMTFIRLETEGLTILPTHRVLHSLRGFDRRKVLREACRYFDCKELRDGRARLLERLAQAGREHPTLGVYSSEGRSALLRLRRDLVLKQVLPDLPESLARLDVVILHRLLLENILGIDPQAVREERNLHYVREFSSALAQVDRGEAQLCFLLNSTPAEAVWENALAGYVLPQKSTDFYPKLLSGLAIYWLDNPAGI